MKKQEIEILETAIGSLQSALPTVVAKRLTPRNSNTPIVRIGAIAFSCVVRGDASLNIPIKSAKKSVNPNRFEFTLYTLHYLQYV